MSMSSAAATAFDSGPFSVGSVLSRAAGLMTRHLLLFAGVSLVAQLPSELVTLSMAGHPVSPHALARSLGITWLLVMILVPVSQTVIYHAAFQDMLGRPIRLGDSLGVAVRLFLPVLGALICMGLAVGFGLLLLVVPGIMLATALSVSVPASVVERLGPIGSLRRSANLTNGYRWKILGIGLLLFVVSLGSSALIALLGFGLGAAIGGLAGFIVQSLVGAFYSIVAVVMYHDLRVAREGVDTDRIAAVFD